MKITKLITLIAITCFANKAVAMDIPLDSQSVRLIGKDTTISSKYGEKCLKPNGGVAELIGLEFSNGTIEYDVAFSKERSFLGVNFRNIDKENTEQFYIRPHQSGNPDANQYTPVYNGLAAWQLYHKGFGGKTSYHFDKWNRVKINVQNEQGEIYVNDMTTPIITIPKFLGPTNKGGISFFSSNKDACFANIKVSNESRLNVKSNPLAESTDIDYIPSFQISNSFPSHTLEKDGFILDEFYQSLKWQALDSDHYGVLNIAKVEANKKPNNTVLASTTVYSEKDTIRTLNFGYSDKVTVFLNGKKIYSGTNEFRSRDYRYLGTIGLFDTLYLPLIKGKNEISFAVTERFGGWGIKATIE